MNKLKARVYDEKLTPFERLVVLMEILRSDEGCSWDIKQTHESLVPYLVEETYEVIEAIENGDSKNLAEELGDLLCQVVFHAQIAKENSTFDINSPIKSITDKLIERHPHIFEESNDLTPQEVRDQWEKIKKEKRAAKGENVADKKLVFGGIPKSMPSLTMAYRIGEKAGGLGFDWKSKEDVLPKLTEETEEIKSAIQENCQEKIEEEIGDLLFATASLARKCHIDPETALKKSLNKFTNRFEKMENLIEKSRKSMNQLSIEELEKIWQSIKE